MTASHTAFRPDFAQPEESFDYVLPHASPLSPAKISGYTELAGAVDLLVRPPGDCVQPPSQVQPLTSSFMPPVVYIPKSETWEPAMSKVRMPIRENFWDHSPQSDLAFQVYRSPEHPLQEGHLRMSFDAYSGDQDLFFEPELLGRPIVIPPILIYLPVPPYDRLPHSQPSDNPHHSSPNGQPQNLPVLNHPGKNANHVRPPGDHDPSGDLEPSQNAPETTDSPPYSPSASASGPLDEPQIQRSQNHESAYFYHTPPSLGGSTLFEGANNRPQRVGNGTSACMRNVASGVRCGYTSTPELTRKHKRIIRHQER